MGDIELKESKEEDTRLKKYPNTKHFHVDGTLGVPHPYMITSKIVVHASKHWNGMLGNEAILDYEKTHGNYSSCGMKGCELKYGEHETALAIHCKIEDEVKLKKYLLRIKSMTEKDGFAGYVLVKCW